MAINKKLIHFKTWNTFLSEQGVNGNYSEPSEGAESTGDAVYGQLKANSVVFIKDVQKIWTHGQLYDCSGNEPIVFTLNTQGASSLVMTADECVSACGLTPAELMSKISNHDTVIINRDGFYFTPTAVVLSDSLDSSVLMWAGADDGIQLVINTSPEEEAIVYYSVDFDYVHKEELSTPDWNAPSTGDGYIKNKTHYLEGEIRSVISNDTETVIDGLYAIMLGSYSMEENEEGLYDWGSVGISVSGTFDVNNVVNISASADQLSVLDDTDNGLEGMITYQGDGVDRDFYLLVWVGNLKWDLQVQIGDLKKLPDVYIPDTIARKEPLTEDELNEWFEN